MPTLVPNSPQRDSSSFRKVVDAFLFEEGLPFADILSVERIERIFAKHDCQFGRHGIYTAAITPRSRRPWRQPLSSRSRDSAAISFTCLGISPRCLGTWTSTSSTPI